MKSLPQASRKSVPMSTIDRDCADACGGSGDGTTLGAADWLCLAAAPTFAVMALLTGVQSSGQPDIFCSAMHDASPLGGMVPMYVLMAAFHLAPWLKLVSSRRSGARRPDPAFAKSNRAKLPSSVNPLGDDEQRRLVRLWHESGEPSCTGIGPVIEVERIPLSLTQFDTIELHCWRNDWMVQRQGNGANFDLLHRSRIPISRA